MNKFRSRLAASIFGMISLGFAYVTFSSLADGMPVTGLLALIAAIIALLASYFSWKQRWLLVVILFLLIYIVGDVTAVYFGARQ